MTTLARRLHIVAAAALAIAPTARIAVDRLPDRLDDAAFWQMVTGFSEAGGSFSSENFVSNEPNFQQVLTRLDAMIRPSSAYIGVGPEQNFTYIANLRPRIAFIVDIRRQNLLQHLMYKAAFELADDRAAFLSLLFSRPRPDSVSDRSTIDELLAAFRTKPADGDLAAANRQRIEDQLTARHRFELTAADRETFAHVHHIFELYGPETGYASNIRTVDFTNGGGHNGNFATILTTTDDRGVNRSFLSTEERFRVVKEMESRNLIVPIVGDFGGDMALRAIARYLRGQDAIVSAFYVSNVEQYLFQSSAPAASGGARKFYESVAELPIDDASTFIRASNSTEIKQPYVGFTSWLGSMKETMQAFRDKGFTTVRDVFALSR